MGAPRCQCCGPDRPAKCEHAGCGCLDESCPCDCPPCAANRQLKPWQQERVNAGLPPGPADQCARLEPWR